jgi:hypothetical protein
MRIPSLLTAAAIVLIAGSDDPRSLVGDRVLSLTRTSSWTLVRSVPIAFRTFHPQGMVKIGDTFFVSSVEVIDREAGKGVGHLFKIDMAGSLLADVRIGEGAVYHPGGLDYDGRHIWVPVAEYRPDSRSIVYRIDPASMKAEQMFRVSDHIGAIVHDTDSRALHGVSWGSRRFYHWTVDGAARGQALNTSHYLDYQDCKYAGRVRMLCTGVTEIRQGSGQAPFRLGGLDLIDLRDGRPLHQVPILLWTVSGLDMTHNPSWLEPSAAGLRAYFMPEDDRSTLYVYDVDAK